MKVRRLSEKHLEVEAENVNELSIGAIVQALAELAYEVEKLTGKKLKKVRILLKEAGYVNE
jgi:hypothetical protein